VGRWTQLWCRGFTANAVQLQPHALACSGRALTPRAGAERTDRKDTHQDARPLRIGPARPVHCEPSKNSKNSKHQGYARRWSGASCRKLSSRTASRPS